MSRLDPQLLVGIIGLLVLLTAYVLWYYFNSKRARYARHQHRMRKSDRVALSAQDKKTYAQAMRLLETGNIRGAARMLEGMDRIRDAIAILEKHKMINEAASILMRKHRPARAGELYVGHRMWSEALTCFKKANLPLEVAKCASELGDHVTASAYYIEAKEYFKAAECLAEIGKHRLAALYYWKVERHEESLAQLQIMIDKNPDFVSIDLSDEEVRYITAYLSKGLGDIRLADIQGIKDQIVAVIVSLIKSASVDRAQKIFQRVHFDIGPQLIAYEDLTHEQAEVLALIFQNSGSYEYAGIAFERLGDFPAAGECFEKAEQFERACVCYERAGLNEKAVESRIKLASVGNQSKKPQPIEEDAQVIEVNPDNGPLFSLGERSQVDSQEATVVEDLTSLTHEVPSPSQAHLARSTLPTPGVPSADSSKEDSNARRQAFWENEFLRDLTSEQRELFWKLGKLQSFPKGSLILDYDEEPVGIYFVLSGHVQVYKPIVGEEHRLDDLHPSDYFGEYWLLIDQASQVRFMAGSLCDLMSISRPDFESLMDSNGTIARKVYKRFSQKLIKKLITSENNLEKYQAS